MNKVEYRPASEGEKRNHQKCTWCANDATQKAVWSLGNVTAISPCCDDSRCMRLSEDRCEKTVAYS